MSEINPFGANVWRRSVSGAWYKLIGLLLYVSAIVGLLILVMESR